MLDIVNTNDKEVYEGSSIHVKYVFIDVVGFTKYDSKHQTYIIYQIGVYVKKILNENAIDDTERILIPTGDGLCIGITKKNGKIDVIDMAVAMGLLKIIHNHNEELESSSNLPQFTIRIGIDENDDNQIKDINGNENLFGEGINRASRVMSLAGSMQIFVSDTVYERLYKRGYRFKLRKVDVRIKHSKILRGYQVIDSACEFLNSKPSVLDNMILNDFGDLYCEMQTLISNANREILIVWDEQDWIWELITSVFKARKNRTNMRIMMTDHNKISNSRRNYLLLNLGCSLEFIGETPFKFEGLIVDQGTESCTMLLIHHYDKTKQKCDGTIFSGSTHEGLINVYYDYINGLVKQRYNKEFIPKLVSVDVQSFCDVLKNGISFYRESDVEIKKVKICDIQPIARRIEEHKMHQIFMLRELLCEHFNSPSAYYLPCGISLLDGSCHYIVPPVLELQPSGKKYGIADGHTRIYISRLAGEIELHAVVINRPSDRLPSELKKWDVIELTRSTNKDENHGGINKQLARKIETKMHEIPGNVDISALFQNITNDR